MEGRIDELMFSSDIMRSQEILSRISETKSSILKVTKKSNLKGKIPIYNQNLGR